MSPYRRILTAVLLMLTVVVLVLNARYLYVAPVANAWTWWQGDETWLMSEYKEFLTTAHFINPTAPGSVYSVSSGLIFGSCYLTAIIYGLPTLFITGRSIAVGRTISWLFSILTLIAVWRLGKRYHIRPELRAFGVLILSSTLCFFLTSHSARYDMLVGLTLLLSVGYLPRVLEMKDKTRAILLALFIPASLVLCGHLLILSALVLAFSSWQAGIWKARSLFVRAFVVAAAGLGGLLALQVLLLGSFSVTGPFIRDAHLMPFYRFFHPQAQLSNLEWRLFVARLWAPGLLLLSMVLFCSVLWAALCYRARFENLPADSRQFLLLASLLVLSSVYIEYSEPRYLIFVLPTITLAFIMVAEFLLRSSSIAFARVFMIALAGCMSIGVWHYEAQARMMGETGEQITKANARAMDSALADIHAVVGRGRPRIFASIPAEAVAMDDSCTMLTSLLYAFPTDTTVDRATLWGRARIEFGIFVNTTDRAVRDGTDSILSWSSNDPPKLIYQTVGPLSDIERPYDPANLRLQDTLRVYEYQKVVQAADDLRGK